MKLELLLPFDGRGRSQEQFFHELREEAIEAEAQGFDGCFWRTEVAPDWLILSLGNGTEPSHQATMDAIRLRARTS